MQKNIAIVILSILISCNSKVKVPDDILPPDKMEAVMWDFIRADEYANMMAESDTAVNRDAKKFELYQHVLQLHHLSKKDFKRNLKFYESRPDVLKVVLDSLQGKGFKAVATAE